MCAVSDADARDLAHFALVWQHCVALVADFIGIVRAIWNNFASARIFFFFFLIEGTLEALKTVFIIFLRYGPCAGAQ